MIRLHRYYKFCLTITLLLLDFEWHCSASGSLLLLSQIAPDQPALNQFAQSAPAQVMHPTGSIRMLIITGSIEASTQVRFDCWFHSIVARSCLEPSHRFGTSQIRFDCWFNSIVVRDASGYTLGRGGGGREGGRGRDSEWGGGLGGGVEMHEDTH